MKTILANIWKRRWCRLLLAGTILCALPLLHPFVRQSIFGPTIDGIPWCVWENEVRREADPDHYQRNWFYDLMRKFGLLREEVLGLPPRNAAGLPLYIRLAEDRDVRVRRLALHQLAHLPRDRESEILPIFRQHLHDDDPECRLIAANRVWMATKDIEAKPAVLPLLDHHDSQIRRQAVYVLTEMAEDAPDLFDPLSKLAEDFDAGVRIAAVSSMRYFGKRGLPILRKALRDKSIRVDALHATAHLGENDEEAISILLGLQNDPDPSFRRFVAQALYVTDPKRFAKPASGDD